MEEKNATEDTTKNGNEENSSKKEKIKRKDKKKSGHKVKVSEKNKSAVANKNWIASGWDLGFLQNKFIKNIFCCLSERQQIGKNIFWRF